jgi:hypothetical protein
MRLLEGNLLINAVRVRDPAAALVARKAIAAQYRHQPIYGRIVESVVEGIHEPDGLEVSRHVGLGEFAVAHPFKDADIVVAAST